MLKVTINSLLWPILLCIQTSIASETGFATAFDAPAGFNDHFETTKPAQGVSEMKYDSHADGFGIRKTGPGLQSSFLTKPSETVVIGDATTSARFRFATLLKGPTFGLWARVDAHTTTGYLGIISFTDTETVRLRIYASDSNPGKQSAGTPLAEKSLKVHTPFSTREFYRGSFQTVSTPDGKVLLRLNISANDGPQLATIEATDSSKPRLAPGRSGIRISGQTVIWDDFKLSPTQ